MMLEGLEELALAHILYVSLKVERDIFPGAAEQNIILQLGKDVESAALDVRVRQAQVVPANGAMDRPAIPATRHVRIVIDHSVEASAYQSA